MNRTVIILLALLTIKSSQAGVSTYQCQVLDESLVNGEGRMYRHQDPPYRFVGDRFAVNRSNGEVIGGPIAQSPFTRTTVVSDGSASTAFKVIYVTGHDVEILQIREFALGKNKPFMAMTLLEVFTGICE